MHASRLMLAPLVGAALVQWGCSGAGTLTGAGGTTASGSGARTGTPANPLGVGAVGGFAGTSGGGGIDPSPSCFNAGGPAMPLSPEIIIVLDASASMNTDMNNLSCDGGCGPRSKWAATVAAINSSVSETSQLVTWGLELFGMTRGNLCETFDGWFGAAVMIPPALDATTSANGGVLGSAARPTRGAVAAASKFLIGISDVNPKYLVLVTDGVPGCASSGVNADDTGATVDAITAAATSGVPTYVVGIATASGSAHDSMTMMAQAGQVGLIAPGARVDYFQASTSDAIRQALTTIVDDTAGCTFYVPEPPPDASRDWIWVTLNGYDIPHDFAAGWDFVDATQTSIRLHGASCATAKNAGSAALLIRFRCPLV